MVLTTTLSPKHTFSPHRGTTLPPNLTLKDIQSKQNNPHPPVTKAHTLPNHRVVQTRNEVNKLQLQGDFPLVSRNTPSSLSILSSLPNSDNEALNFENSALHLTEDAVRLSMSPTPLPDGSITPTEEASGARLNPAKFDLDCHLGYRDGNLPRVVGPNAGGLMDSFFGCFRPFVNFIGKPKPSELENQSDNWEIPFESISDLEWLGSGAQGAVFVGHWKNELVAVKKVKEVAETNIHHLRKLNHPNVVQFRGVSTQTPCYCIIMEYCPNGPLYNFLRDEKQRVPPKRLVDWTRQVASGMKYLHDHKIIHRDLKSPNILIGRNEIIKISDFGTSRSWGGDQSTCMSFAGTVAWMAPEVIRNEPCNEKVDIWSFGVCLWELLTCEIPYRNVDSSAVIWGVGSNSLQLPIPTSCPEGFKLLVKQCWATKPRNRPSFKHILMHLDIAAAEIMSFKPEEYFRTQQSWKKEVWEHNEQMKGEDVSMPIAGQDILVKKRKQELKHAQDVKMLYERKLKMVNDLYMELSAWKLRLEEAERALARRERQVSIHGSKVHYKKKHRPFAGKTPERFQKRPSRSLSTSGRGRKTSPSTPEVLSTSPESPFKIPPPTMILGHQPANLCSTGHFELGGDEDPAIVMSPRKLPYASIDCTDARHPNDDEGIRQYHPTAEKMKVRKPRHRRTGSHGSGNLSSLTGASPRNSPHGERRVSCQGTPRFQHKSPLTRDHPDGQSPSPLLGAAASPTTLPKDLSSHSLNGNGGPMLTSSPNLESNPNQGTLSLALAEHLANATRFETSSSSDDNDSCQILPELLAQEDEYLRSFDPRLLSMMKSHDHNDVLSRSVGSGMVTKAHSHRRGGSLNASLRISSGMTLRLDSCNDVNANEPNPEDIVRFDDEDGGGESTDSSDEEDELPSNGNQWCRAHTPDDSDEENPRFMLRRRSTVRRPIRAKNRQSIISMQSVSTISSEEGNTTEYPCSSQRSTLNSNPEIVQRIQAMNMSESGPGSALNLPCYPPESTQVQEDIDDEDLTNEDHSDDHTLQNDDSILDLTASSSNLPSMNSIQE
eukprot:maker-scaffold2896_size11495-snap-gene-0.2 protein:Tk10817 transcript:maker-scaffold2896_size11495-snap-gene-0.2-mRNA-1 annotation:"mitogen-activated protein kinase kinase kinase 13 isoform x4"